MGCWNKFRLLMWKNWKLQSRRPIAFIVEVGIPVLIIAIFTLVRSQVKKSEQHEVTYDPLPISTDRSEWVRAYTPNNNKLINNIMTSFSKAKAFENAKEMEKYLSGDDMADDSNLGIQFDPHMSQELSNIKNMSIAFRFVQRHLDWHTEKLFPPFELGYSNRHSHNMNDDNGYSRTFAPLMYSITSKLLSESGKKVQLPEMFIQRFPYPSYLQDYFLVVMNQASLFGYLFMTAFIYAHINAVKSITYEKEKQLKESMKIMGLPTWLHWTAWFCKFLIPYLIITIFLVIMMKYETNNGPTLMYADCCLLFIFFLLFLCAMITYSFALSVFFTKANRASAMAGIIWVISLLPYILTRGSDNPNKVAKYFSSLSVASAMAHGFDVIILREGSMQGVRWHNLFRADLRNDISFGGILLMLIVDLIMYMLIALYVEAIYPGEFGVPRKWYFLFTSEFWSKRNTEQDDFLLDPNNSEFFDEEPTDLKAGICIKSLGKSFGSNEAVKDLSLNMYEDQITVLLGHNGAGKTTTMSMLTGMFPPTKGTALVNGYDIRTQIMSVRDSMGLCPQHNVLFDELTVKEHLIFFSRLKGCTGPRVEEEVDKYLNLLALKDKTNVKSAQLSGGMKRKLSVGIALCGNSKIIMLDEPTAGMDPSARRFIWEFLQKQKKGRTILLTTHFMDEADLLGDRIAIMSGGELQCCGTSFFLKKKFGTGYHLVIDQTPTCNPNNITNVLRKYIPNVAIESNAGTELTYLLPETYAPKFTKMLAELENNSGELGIRSFGISLTDLEEVFMKVGRSQSGRALPTNRIDDVDGRVNNTTNVTIGISNKENGASLYVNQIIAIGMKKLLTVKRSWGMEVLKIVLSLVYIILIFSIDLSSLKNQNFKERSFDLNQYDKPITLVETNGNLQEPYVHMLNGMKQAVEFTDNMTERLLDLTKKSPYLVRYNYIVGASFQTGKAYAWFNGEPYHSIPLSVQLILQQNYKAALGDDFNLEFTNYPLPRNVSEDTLMGIEVLLQGFNLISLSLAVSYIGCFYILFNIKEKMSQAKHLQFVSGVNVFIFRLVSFACDLLTYMLAAVAIIITLAILKPEGLATSEEIGIISLMLFSFGVAVIPWMYLFAFLFTVPSTGYSRMFFLSFLTGFPSQVVVFLLVNLKWKHASIVQWILRIFPHFNFMEATQVLLLRHICAVQKDICVKKNPMEYCKEMLTQTGCTQDGSIFSFGTANGLGLNVLMLYMIALVTFCFLFLIDLKVITYLSYMVCDKFQGPPSPPPYVDPDVEQENEFVKSQPLHELQSRFILVLRDLTKRFRRLTAVNGLNLTVKKSECFGLLGVNGAGKTTTFRMMTGDEMISYGDGWVNGFSLRNDMKKVHRFVGYCPQFDALLDNLTARETLKIFGLIRGVPRDECNYTAEKLAKDFDFTEHLDKQVAQLSGGNKRKLSTAVALIGDSPIIFLDEPTTGMDPATKRHLWNKLSQIRESGKCIILTSHSMEECEALCTRLTIMVNGNFKCLGSVQHLKSKFAEGYCVTLKVKKPEHSSGLEHSDTTQIEDFMRQNFPAAKLKEKHQELLTYYIKDKNISWSKLFGILEQAKTSLNIQDYSVGQASLEQVFLSFTMDQNSDGTWF